jgi:hypothetical protein
MEITIDRRLTEEQHRLVVLSVGRPGSLSREEWKQVFQAIDYLRSSVIRLEEETLTFGAFYERFVDVPYADAYLTELEQLPNVGQAGVELANAYVAHVRRTLADMGLEESSSEPERLLMTYCLYWWSSFAKGYILELSIYRDLAETGIVFEAHDWHDRIQRFAAHDLIVSSQRGDIKSSTYFLYVARSFPLRCEFYISRTFDPQTRQWHHIVLLKREAWDIIDGDTIPRSFSEGLHSLIGPIEMDVFGEPLVVANYALWKQKIRLYQQKKAGEQ